MADQTTIRPGLCIPRVVLERWTGPMTDNEVDQLTHAFTSEVTTSAVQHAVVPHAVAAMVWALRERDSNAETCDECRRRIPIVPDGAAANRYHDLACSLYDPDQE